MNDLVAEMAAKLKLNDDQREDLARFMVEAERGTETSVAAEIEAMSRMVEALEPLSVEARERVLGWAKSRFTYDTSSMLDMATRFAQIVAAKQREVGMRERVVERRERELESTGAAGEDTT